MPCFILTGYPSAGKTKVAKLLEERARKHASIDDVVLVSDSTACPDCTQQQCFENAEAEKQTRAALKSSFDRAVGSSNERTLVILDSLNYIKGFRYELHCLSKAAGERHGLLWVLNQASVVEQWNNQKPNQERDAYSTSLLKELIQRYEPPDERNRWDKPLYTVNVAPQGNTDTKREAVQKSVYNMHSLGETLVETNEGDGMDKKPSMPSQDEEPVKKKPVKSAFSRAKRKPAGSTKVSQTTSPSTIAPTIPTPQSSKEATAQDSEKQIQQTVQKPLEEQLDDILDAFLVHVQPLQQGSSTRQHIARSANSLAEFDATTQRLISSITTAQTLHTGGKLQVSCGEETLSVDFPRPVALPELRRLRRQYLQWVGTHPPDDTSERGIADSFLRYVEAQMR